MYARAWGSPIEAPAVGFHDIENALNVVKRAIFKKIVELTLLKRFAIVPLSP